MSPTVFLAIMLASMLAPVPAIGYLLAGIFVRNYWLAISAGVVWRLSLFMVLAPPGASRSLLPALAGAVVFVSIIFLIRRVFRKKEAPKTALDQVQDAARKIIPPSFRKLAAANGCAPSEATSDEQIMAIYREVGTRFREASQRRGEHLPAGSMNAIVFKFLNVHEKMGRELYETHLTHELMLYEKDGLREDYKREIKLF